MIISDMLPLGSVNVRYAPTAQHIRSPAAVSLKTASRYKGIMLLADGPAYVCKWSSLSATKERNGVCLVRANGRRAGAPGSGNEERARSSRAARKDECGIPLDHLQ